MSEIKNKHSAFKGVFSILGVLAIIGSAFGGYLYYNNLESELSNSGKTALAANIPSNAFNPSDCATYTPNGGTSSGGLCFAKLYEKNGQLFSSLDVAPGEIVKVRNYYNNTNTASALNVAIKDSIPTGFTQIGSTTNNYVDANPVTLNNNVFSGQNLTVAPGAGYFGYATDNTLTSSNLELGKKIYLNACYRTIGLTGQNAADNYIGGTTNDISNTSLTTTCDQAFLSGGQTTALLGNGYFDTFGGRYLIACYRNISVNGQNAADNYIGGTTNDISNTSLTTTCDQAFLSGGQTTALLGNGYFDTSDTTRGYGYISYSMQTPTTGVANGDQKGTTGTLQVDIDTTRVSGAPASLTITNVQSPNISYTKLYSVDGGSTWSPTVTAITGQSIRVRLWNENTGGLSATNGNKGSPPQAAGYSLLKQNCLF